MEGEVDKALSRCLITPFTPKMHSHRSGTTADKKKRKKIIHTAKEPQGLIQDFIANDNYTIIKRKLKLQNAVIKMRLQVMVVTLVYMIWWV